MSKRRRQSSLTILDPSISGLVFKRFGVEIVDKYYGIGGLKGAPPADDDADATTDTSDASSPASDGSSKRRRKAAASEQHSSAMLVPNAGLCVKSRRLLVGVNEIMRQAQRTASSDDNSSSTLSPSLILVHLPPPIPAPMNPSKSSSSGVPNMYHPLLKLTSSFFPSCHVVALTSGKESDETSTPSHQPPSSKSFSLNRPSHSSSPVPSPHLSFDALLFPNRRLSRTRASSSSAPPSVSSRGETLSKPSLAVSEVAKTPPKEKRIVSVVAFFADKGGGQSGDERQQRWERSVDRFVEFVQSEVDVAKRGRKNN